MIKKLISGWTDFWMAVSDISELASGKDCQGTRGGRCQCGFAHGRYFPAFPTCLSVQPLFEDLSHDERRMHMFFVLEKTFKGLHPDYIRARPSPTIEQFVYYGVRNHGDIIAASWIPVVKNRYEHVALYTDIRESLSLPCAYSISIGVVCRPFIERCLHQSRTTFAKNERC
ncbi:MAG: hypothetical protein HGB03_01570 [Candidatus Yonathbacteria bacterium]|nr:hypothetical protein [Candidatus Yonathbacteria bacterium]NTW47953.1 hypothetical protein [Candidatus Yonathbacteria bacterium]